VGEPQGIAGPAFLGSRRWLMECGQCEDPGVSPATGEESETLVAWEGRIRGQFLIGETLRPGATQVLQALRHIGLKTVILTGDRSSRTKTLALALGVECWTELLPDDKLSAIGDLRRSAGAVAMIGDGINDAPALAAADVGMALGCGTDIARHSSAICLLGNDLTRLPWLLRLARRTVHTIRWNLVWALTYNTIGIGLAAVGRLHPVFAAFAMGASSLLVVANSLALARFETAAEDESATGSVSSVRKSEFNRFDNPELTPAEAAA
jgi:P-type E1-E2 ATPase